MAVYRLAGRKDCTAPRGLAALIQGQLNIEQDAGQTILFTNFHGQRKLDLSMLMCNFSRWPGTSALPSLEGQTI
jgi:hypothetical protein